MQETKSLNQLVLIVDDVPKNLQVLGSVLKNDGHRVAFAKSGEAALEYVAQSQPDLILLDIMMPGMDGYEVCRRLKTDPVTKNIPVIFISALSEDEDEYLGFELGGIDYITKPFNPKIVNVRVKMHLQLKRKTDMLEKLVSIDGLTEIPNRRSFDETLTTEWNRAKRDKESLSLVLIDIDFFKKYNDSYGHAAGDECLRSVAQTLSNTPQRPADLVARYGGEEFAAILPDTGCENAIPLAEKMRENVEALKVLHEANEASEHVTISLGVATTIPGDNSTPLALIEEADKCLYNAKETGRNRYSSVDCSE